MLTYITTLVTSALGRLRRTDDGATLVEYALLVALIAVVCIVAVALVGSNASTKFSTIASAVQ